MGPVLTPGWSGWRFILYGLKLQAGQLREGVGPRPDHRFLTIRVCDHTCAERLLGGQRGVMLGYPQAFVVGSIYAKRCIHGRILRYTKYGQWVRQIKMIGQRKTGRKVHFKWFKLPWGYNSGTCSLILPMCLSTHIVPFSSLNTLLSSLLSILEMEILFCKAEGPHLSPTPCLVARLWCLHCCDLASVSGWKPRPCSKSLKAEATADRTRPLETNTLPGHSLHEGAAFGNNLFPPLQEPSLPEFFPHLFRWPTATVTQDCDSSPGILTVRKARCKKCYS